jgi:hypothetical protein
MRALASLTLVVCVSACGSEEDVGRTQPDDAGTDAPTEAAVEAGPPIRSIERRNPLGEARADNLLVDGDFELTSGNGQYGWLGFNAGQQGNLVRETGGLCRSGLTCGVLTSEMDFLGQGTAPKGQSFDVSVYTKPPQPDCGLTQVLLLRCTGVTFNIGTIAQVPPASFEPDADGWCLHQANVPVQDVRPCLWVTSAAGLDTRTLVDQASIVPVTGESKASALAAFPPSPETYERITRALRSMHERMPIGRGHPSEMR